MRYLHIAQPTKACALVGTGPRQIETNMDKTNSSTQTMAVFVFLTTIFIHITFFLCPFVRPRQTKTKIPKTNRKSFTALWQSPDLFSVHLEFLLRQLPDFEMHLEHTRKFMESWSRLVIQKGKDHTPSHFPLSFVLQTFSHVASTMRPQPSQFYSWG